MALILVMDDDDELVNEPLGPRVGPLVAPVALTPLEDIPEGTPEHDGVARPWERPEHLRPPRPTMVPDADGEPRCVQDRPCLVITYAHAFTPSIPAEVVEVRVTPETLDPAWWRAQLGPVSMFAELYPDGNSSPQGIRSGRKLWSYGPDSDPSPVRVELPKLLLVQFPGAGELVAVMPTGRETMVHGEAVPVLRVSDAGAARLRAAWKR